MQPKSEFQDELINADLHNHLRTSSRIRSRDFDRTADIVSARLGIDGIISMVNFGDDRYEKLIKQPGYDRVNLGNAVHIPITGITIIKGQEVPTKQGHLLVLGLKEGVHLKHGQSIQDTVDAAEDNNGIIIADHPYYFEGCGDYLAENPKILEQLDAIEVFNGEACFGLPFGPLKQGANERARRLFQGISQYCPNLGCLTSSDGHSFHEIGKSYSKIQSIRKYTDSDVIIKDLRCAIRNHRDTSMDKQGILTGKIGAIIHATKMVAILGINEIYHRAIEFENKQKYR